MNSTSTSAVGTDGNHRYAYVTGSYIGETGKTKEDALQAMRAVVGPDAELSVDNVRPMTSRFAIYVAAHGTPKRWSEDYSGALDLADKKDAREAAILEFLADLPEYIAAYPEAIAGGWLELTFGHESQDPDDLEGEVAPEYVLEFGLGAGTWTQEQLDMSGDVIAQIRDIVREHPDGSWDADEEQIEMQGRRMKGLSDDD